MLQNISSIWSIEMLGLSKKYQTFFTIWSKETVEELGYFIERW